MPAWFTEKTSLRTSPKCNLRLTSSQGILSEVRNRCSRRTRTCVSVEDVSPETRSSRVSDLGSRGSIDGRVRRRGSSDEFRAEE